MKKLLIAPIRLYQNVLSPLLPPVCRFRPTCSQYMIESIEKHGVKGVLMSTARLCRCHPFSTPGDDPVPEQFSLRRTRTEKE